MSIRVVPRHWLHRRNIHRFCQITKHRVETGRDYRQKWLVGANGDRLDMTAFGGEPTYETIEMHC